MREELGWFIWWFLRTKALALINCRLSYYLCSVNNIEGITDKVFTFVDIHGHLPILTGMHSNGQRLRLQEPGAIAHWLVSHYDERHLLSYPNLSIEDTEVGN